MVGDAFISNLDPVPSYDSDFNCKNGQNEWFFLTQDGIY